MLEDGVEHRASTFHEPLDVRRDLAVDVREEQELFLALDHEAGEVDGTEVVLHSREVGHQWGQLLSQRLCVGRSFDREVDHEMTLAHRVLLGLRAESAAAAAILTIVATIVAAIRTATDTVGHDGRGADDGGSASDGRPDDSGACDTTGC